MNKLLRKIYSQSYFIDSITKKKKCITHYILPHFYKDRSFLIFYINKILSSTHIKFNSNFSIFNPNSIMELNIKMSGNRVLHLTFLGWEY
jgi:hypothetical protein